MLKTDAEKASRIRLYKTTSEPDAIRKVTQFDPDARYSRDVSVETFHRRFKGEHWIR